jgi:hypothetical protein
MLQTMPDLVEVRTHNGTQSVRLVTNGSHAPVVTADMTNLQQLIVRAFDSAPQEPDGWTDLSSLGTVLPELEAGFKTKTYGHSNLTKLLQSMPDFVDVEIRDGVLDRVELTAYAVAQFNKMDLNKDRFLTEDEFHKAQEAETEKMKTLLPTLMPAPPKQPAAPPKPAPAPAAPPRGLPQSTPR